LVSRYGQALFGRHMPQSQFPLLFKFLDCQRTLSVQVHPNDEQGAQLDPPDLGKTEAWVVLAAEKGARIYAGLKPGVNRATLERATAEGSCETYLYEFEPRVGDCLLIEAGTVHALGADLLVAEIQQASDTTFRLFDWNRIDTDGKPRALHIDEALDTIDYSRGPVNPVTPQPSTDPAIEYLAESDKFVIDRWRMDTPHKFINDNRFHILAIVEGQAAVQTNAETRELSRGDTLLVPACIPAFQFLPRSHVVVLDMYLP